MTSFYIDDLIAVESRFDLYVLCQQETVTHLEFRYKEESVTNNVIFFTREVYLHIFTIVSITGFNQLFSSKCRYEKNNNP